MPASVNEVWEVVLIAVVNEVLKHKNKIIFKGRVMNVLEVFALVGLVMDYIKFANFSFYDWCIDSLVYARMIS